MFKKAWCNHIIENNQKSYIWQKIMSQTSENFQQLSIQQQLSITKENMLIFKNVGKMLEQDTSQRKIYE